MSAQLTPEQHDAVTARSGLVVYFLDAQTQKQYAMMPVETFQKVQALCDPQERFDIEDFYPLVDAAWKSIIDDTALDVYTESIS